MGGIFRSFKFHSCDYIFISEQTSAKRMSSTIVMVLPFQRGFIRTIFDKDCEILYLSYTLTKSTTTVKHKLLFLNIFLAFT